MVYYKSMRGFRAAITRRIDECSFLCFRDDGTLSGTIEILHRLTEADIMSKITDIMNRVHDYNITTVYLVHGFSRTTIVIKQLSEVAGPIANEFLTINN